MSSWHCIGIGSMLNSWMSDRWKNKSGWLRMPPNVYLMALLAGVNVSAHLSRSLLNNLAVRQRSKILPKYPVSQNQRASLHRVCR